LRVLGDSLGIDGFNFNTVEEVKNSALDGLDIKALFNNEASCEILPVGSHALTSVGLGQDLERLADVPIYFTDAIVRRAPSLQLTVDSKRAMKVGLPVGLFKQMDLQEGDSVRVLQDGLQVVMPATMQQGLAEGVVRVSAGTAASALLGSMFGRLEVQRA
jgi:NADH-quinone oxidoreductase subunit G